MVLDILFVTMLASFAARNHCDGRARLRRGARKSATLFAVRIVTCVPCGLRVGALV